MYLDLNTSYKKKMPRCSEALTDQRKTEIIDACEKLYRTRGFKNITIKDIGMEISCSRPSIYNYFETREEIFLALLTREYEDWIMDIQKIADREERLDADELAAKLAHTLEKRTVLLKISAMNLYEIEENCRLERLAEYKKVFRSCIDAFGECLERHLPDVSGEKMAQIQYVLFPFMLGIYPYVYPTDKQCEAMDEAGIKHPEITVYSITYNLLKQVLK